MSSPARPPQASTARTRLVDAAVRLIRKQGFAGATVEDICREATLSKGAFFHHFKTKQELGHAAAAHFAAFADSMFGAAPFTRLEDPRERVLAYLAFRKSLLQGQPADYTCLLGTIVQEAHETHPALRDACAGHIGDHAAGIAADLIEAKARYAPRASWSPDSLALFTQAVLQGAFVLAKAKGASNVAADCIDHLVDYVELLLPLDEQRRAA